MLYSKVFLRLHWGFSIVNPTTKAKFAFYLPPPTTLVGALSYYKFRGKDSVSIGKSFGSPAYKLDGVRATAKLLSYGTYIEDIVRNVVNLFQGKKTDKGIPRRLNPKYRFNVIPTGKVYSPNGMLVAVYITSTLTKEELEKMSWGITRIGCKECLVSVEDVEIGEAQKVSGVVETSYYFPATVKIVEGEEFVTCTTFWDKEVYVWGKKVNPITYALPLLITYPLTSVEVKVEATESYKVGDEYVVFA